MKRIGTYSKLKITGNLKNCMRILTYPNTQLRRQVSYVLIFFFEIVPLEPPNSVTKANTCCIMATPAGSDFNFRGKPLLFVA